MFLDPITCFLTSNSPKSHMTKKQNITPTGYKSSYTFLIPYISLAPISYGGLYDLYVLFVPPTAWSVTPSFECLDVGAGMIQTCCLLATRHARHRPRKTACTVDSSPTMRNRPREFPRFPREFPTESPGNSLGNP